MGAVQLVPSPTGTTTLIGVVGDPVAQVQAPALMNQHFSVNKIDAVSVAMHVPVARFAQAINGLKAIENLSGIVITVPHKVAICQHADTLSETARLAGSANALCRGADGRWLAENFDGLGFVQGLRNEGRDPDGRHVLLVGTGGAGMAIAAALVRAGVKHLTLVDADPAKAASLAARLNEHRGDVASAPRAPEMDIFDLAINATPLGMQSHDALPFSPDGLPPHAIVADIVMKPARTRLMEMASARGLRIHEGIHMLMPQIEMYATFFGI